MKTSRNESAVIVLGTTPRPNNSTENAMTAKEVKIHYADDETGPAEVLSGRVARITDTPLFNLELCRDSIVLLDRAPSNDNAIPRIKKVLHNPYPCRTPVSIYHEEEASVLMDVFRMLGADSQIVIQPTNEKPGILLVSHPEHLNPPLLAEATGIEQCDEEGNE
jgi:hypothetical protein